ncbi:MAG: RNA methyltransferase [Bacteroidales bacterium]
MAVLSTNQIKFIRSLSNKKFRQESGLFIAEGEKIVAEALKSNFIIRDVYRVEDIGEECMGRISCLSSPSPVLAVIEQKKDSPHREEELLNSANYSSRFPLCLALDGVRDPGNLGTIIRIADWFGIDAIFASKDTVELYNPKVVQATMGAIFRKEVMYGNLSGIIKEFSANELPVYGTFMDGENLYNKNIECKGLIVMGSESFGISKEIEQLISHKLLIPSYPVNSHTSTSESLNVAIATAVICAEFRR